MLVVLQLFENETACVNTQDPPKTHTGTKRRKHRKISGAFVVLMGEVYMDCTMKLPVFSAASSCIRLVAWA